MKFTMHLHLGIRQYNLNQRVTRSQLFPQSPRNESIFPAYVAKAYVTRRRRAGSIAASAAA
jgi:hypothetical protein